MRNSVETRPDGSTLVIRIPMQFQRRGGRKRIVAPDGSAIVPTSKPQPDGTLVKALARAWRWQELLDQGLYASVAEISEGGALEFVCQQDPAPGADRTEPRGGDPGWASRPPADARRAEAAAAGKLGGAACSHSRA
jgi:hypothetical protein